MLEHNPSDGSLYHERWTETERWLRDTLTFRVAGLEESWNRSIFVQSNIPCQHYYCLLDVNRMIVKINCMVRHQDRWSVCVCCGLCQRGICKSLGSYPRKGIYMRVVSATDSMGNSRVHRDTHLHQKVARMNEKQKKPMPPCTSWCTSTSQETMCIIICARVCVSSGGGDDGRSIQYRSMYGLMIIYPIRAWGHWDILVIYYFEGIWHEDDIQASVCCMETGHWENVYEVGWGSRTKRGRTTYRLYNRSSNLAEWSSELWAIILILCIEDGRGWTGNNASDHEMMAACSL